MKYFLKKSTNIECFFYNLKYVYLKNNILNIDFKILLRDLSFVFYKKQYVLLFLYNYKRRAKLINLIKKSFFHVLRGFCLILEIYGLGFSIVIKNKISNTIIF